MGMNQRAIPPEASAGSTPVIGSSAEVMSADNDKADIREFGEDHLDPFGCHFAPMAPLPASHHDMEDLAQLLCRNFSTGARRFQAGQRGSNPFW